MDDAACVCGVERVGNRDADVDDRVDFERTPSQALLERLAFEQLHDQVVTPEIVTDVVEGADVWMTERGDRPPFPIEARSSARISSRLSGQHLDCDNAIEPRVPGAVHLAHPAGSERLENGVWAEPRAWSQIVSLSLIHRPLQFSRSVICDAAAARLCLPGISDHRVKRRTAVWRSPGQPARGSPRTPRDRNARENADRRRAPRETPLTATVRSRRVSRAR